MEMSVLTVEKKGTELCFNNKRSCGLWLTLVGAVLIAGLAFGGKFLINPIVFLAGYYISFYIANINKKVRAKLSQGSASKFQIRMIFVSITFMFLMMFCIAGPYIPSMNWRMIWLGVNLATGLHFSGFYFVHGKSMIVLGMICTLFAVCGYIFADQTLVFLIADAAVKFIFGVYLLVFGKPSKVMI
jgi:hypothetical protein